MSGTLREVTPNLAELLHMLPNCTNEDVDEVVRFLRILHRGREEKQFGAPGPMQMMRDRSPRRYDGKGYGGYGKGLGKRQVSNPSTEYTFHGREIPTECIAQIEATLCAATTPVECRAALQMCQEDPKLYPGTFAIFGKFCRNCYLSGMGFANTPQHSVAECKAMGNPCWVECRNCADGSCHWIDDCPIRKAGQQFNQGASFGGKGGGGGVSLVGGGPPMNVLQSSPQTSVTSSSSNASNTMGNSGAPLMHIGNNPMNQPMSMPPM